ncbi:hypothetical protein [Stratiformator vulcanicus]|uniref:hypothetical protein n=1 Tax=Stratiformator vulcanicus TaxID=2527980 RepID=UPI0011A07EE4|nr:hypothetical protein [Stratiformator vulcanicus]
MGEFGLVVVIIKVMVVMITVRMVVVIMLGVMVIVVMVIVVVVIVVVVIVVVVIVVMVIVVMVIVVMVIVVMVIVHGCGAAPQRRYDPADARMHTRNEERGQNNADCDCQEETRESNRSDICFHRQSDLRLNKRTPRGRCERQQPHRRKCSVTLSAAERTDGHR